MPSVYLSPSTQEYNPYITGGTEEYYMNLIADAVEPYLTASGIQYSRNTPSMTAGSSLREANRGNYDLYVAMHSLRPPFRASLRARMYIIRAEAQTAGEPRKFLQKILNPFIRSRLKCRPAPQPPSAK